MNELTCLHEHQIANSVETYPVASSLIVSDRHMIATDFPSESMQGAAPA